MERLKVQVLFHVIICLENPYRKRYIVYKRPMKNYFVFIIYFRNKQVTNLIVILCIYDTTIPALTAVRTMAKIKKWFLTSFHIFTDLFSDSDG